MIRLLQSDITRYYSSSFSLLSSLLSPCAGCSQTRVVYITNPTTQLGSTTTWMKKRCRKHKSITNTRNYVKNPNREKTRSRTNTKNYLENPNREKPWSCTQIHYYQRDHRGEEENPHSRFVQMELRRLMIHHT